MFPGFPVWGPHAVKKVKVCYRPPDVTADVQLTVSNTLTTHNKQQQTTNEKALRETQTLRELAVRRLPAPYTPTDRTDYNTLRHS